MTTNDVQDDVLHNESHSKLSDEEIAKAVARHNKHHPDAKAQKQPPPKTKRAGGEKSGT
jgi:hypothetical protein